MKELRYNKSMKDKKEAAAAIEKVRKAIEELAHMEFDEEGARHAEASVLIWLKSFLKKVWCKEL